MRVLTLDEIKAALPSVDLTGEIEKGFVAYSRGESVVPPVGELVMQDPPGDVHIKYGYLKGGDYYVIKIASGFHENPKLGLPSSNGMMLLFSQKTGQAEAVLLDEGYLTDVRTAVAGSIAAKYLARKGVSRIGIVGTGMQARLQLEYLAPVTDCRDVLVWGRDRKKLDAYASDMTSLGFTVATTKHVVDIEKTCDLIVTTTPATAPILTGSLLPGTHVTAMGSDTHDKQELDPAVLRNADLVIADSISQCLERGEICQALKCNAIKVSDIVELGSIIAGDIDGRTSDEQITVADLTGVAVQDIQITTAVFEIIQKGVRAGL
jgi:ornithine cyclodeaminase